MCEEERFLPFSTMLVSIVGWGEELLSFRFIPLHKDPKGHINSNSLIDEVLLYLKSIICRVTIHLPARSKLREVVINIPKVETDKATSPQYIPKAVRRIQLETKQNTIAYTDLYGQPTFYSLK